MRKNYKYFKNLINEGLLNPGNILRVLGMLTGKKAFIGPLKVTIDITNKCDMHCLMCWYHSPNKKDAWPEANFSVDRFTPLAKELRSLGVKTILLTGKGEPLLHPYIFDLIRIAKNNSIATELMTNAYYLDKEKIGFLHENGVKKIIVSLHCADKETFKKIHPLKDGRVFDKIIQNINFINMAKDKTGAPLLFIINVLSRLNYENMEKMATLAENVKADKLLFKPFYNPRLENEDFRIPEEFKQELIHRLLLVKACINIPNNINAYVNAIKMAAINNKFNRPRNFSICHMPWSHAAIELEGKVFGCAYGKDHPLGNINTSNFADIWHSKEYEAFRRKSFCPNNCLGKAVYPMLLTKKFST